jgi:hypothetical protein
MIKCLCILNRSCISYISASRCTVYVTSIYTAPTSAILAEIYIQNMEHTQIYNILTKQHIIAYFRYVDDILIVYDNMKTNIDNMINEFNKLQSKIEFTLEKENQKTIFF